MVSGRLADGQRTLDGRSTDALRTEADGHRCRRRCPLLWRFATAARRCPAWLNHETAVWSHWPRLITLTIRHPRRLLSVAAPQQPKFYGTIAGGRTFVTFVPRVH